MSVQCGLVSKEFRSLYSGINLWAKKNSTKEIFNDPFEAALKLVNSNFNMELKHLRYIKDLTPGQVRGFLARLTELTGKVKQGDLDNNFAKFFYQTGHYGPKDPVIGNLLNDMQRVQFNMRSSEVADKSDMKFIVDELRDEALVRNFESAGMQGAELQRQRLKERRTQALVDYKNAELRKDLESRKAAEERINGINKEMDRLIQRTHLSVYDEMIKVIEVSIPEAVTAKFNEIKSEAYTVTKKGKLKVKDKRKAAKFDRIQEHKEILRLSKDDIGRLVVKPDGTPLKDSPHLYSAVVTYQKLMGRLYNTLRNGINMRINSVIGRMKYLGQADSDDARGLEVIRKRMEEKYMPKYENGFYPHYVKTLNAEFMDGMMQHFDDLQRSVNGRDKGEKKSVKDVINGMNLYMDKHTSARAKDLETGKFGYDYSRDFLNSVRNYISDINRFNFISFMDGHMLESLTSVERIYKADGAAKGYAQNLVDFITDMHMATNGDTSVSPNTKAWMRTVLGLEFVSKLGLNPRSAARNWFQRLLDFVTWSPLQIKKSKDYLKAQMIGGTSSENYIDSVLKDNGLLYDEVAPEYIESQLQAPSSMFKVIEWNNDAGKFEAVKKSRIEKVSEKVSWMAGKTSWLHRKAENNNRKHTFKLAYSQMHRWLNIPNFRNPLAEKGKSEAQIDSSIRKLAERYAVKMTIMNHFDYADYAKSQALRSKVGRFAGQFQHFAFEFFERNMKILRESKYDVLEGNLVGKDASGLSQAYRMSFLYFLAPMIASVYSGVDFSNLVEHDTAQRLKQWATFFLGDDDEVAEAFYGKGPMISTFGGPITSDIIDIGIMMDLIDLDDDSILTLISGMENYDPYKNSSDTTKKIRILNTFLGRAFERHVPQLQKGRIGWAVQQELGLYPTAEARKAQRKVKKLRKQVLPADIEKALRQLSQ